MRRIDESFRWGVVGGQDLVTGHELEPAADGSWRFLVKTRRLPDGEPETLGVLTTEPNEGAFVDPIRRRAIRERASVIYEQPLAGSPRRHRGACSGTTRRSVRGSSPRTASGCSCGALSGAGGSGRSPPVRGCRDREIDRPGDASWSTWSAKASEDGRWLAAGIGEEGSVLLWDLRGPVAAGPRVLRRDARVGSVALHPSGSWMAVRDNRALTLWPRAGRQPHVLRAPTKGLWALAIDPRGKWVAAAGQSSSQAWLWPLAPEAGAERLTLETGGPVAGLAVSPRGDRLAAGAAAAESGWCRCAADHSSASAASKVVCAGLDFDPEGRRLAVGRRRPFVAEGEGRAHLGPRDAHGPGPRPRRRTAPLVGGVLARRPICSPPAAVACACGTSRPPVPRSSWKACLSLAGARTAASSWASARGLGPGGAVGTALVYDLERKEAKPLETHGNQVTCVAWDLSGRFVVTGSRDGVVRVGPVTGEEPHLLFGHEAGVRDVEAGPDGTWIASASEDGTVRLWPLPLEERPFHTLPHGELLERLRSLTNFRVVRDAASVGGYRLDFEPFTGWNREPPSW